MNSYKKASITFYILAILPMVAGGLVYSLRQQFMPYHAAAAGRAWEELDHGLQVLILACINGAGSLMLIYRAAYRKKHLTDIIHF